MWVDTHCHLQLAEADPGELMDQAAAAGVGWVVVPGIDAASSAAAERLASSDGRLRWAAGLHPHDASYWPEQAVRIIELATRADAVGEIGLDFYRSLSPRSDQMEAFRAQLDLAVGLDVPVIVHCRDAFSALFDVLEETGAGPRSVLHCWTAGPRWTRRFRDLDVTFSYAGPIAFENGDTIRRGAAEAPPGQTMVETDTPLLSPPPHRAEENRPANVVLVGRALAEVWGMTADEVEHSTTAVAERVFG
ncbi:MAG: TatD family hydrolase [Acidimicrobiia bacterium]|nr:TatD family hydrolase [Acidimicrobiia bacterium]NNL68724.1 TatD family hydrolase [Acidimicrobiia bacterium]